MYPQKNQKLQKRRYNKNYILAIMCILDSLALWAGGESKHITIGLMTDLVGVMNMDIKYVLRLHQIMKFTMNRGDHYRMFDIQAIFVQQNLTNRL